MITGRQQRLGAERRALNRLSPQSWIDRQRQRLDDLSQAAHKTATHRLRLQRERVNSLSSRVSALNPTATLERGYAIVRRVEDNQVVVRIRQVAPGDQLSVQVSDGAFESTVQDGNA
jgi:exodeoxyribonuclease VII large subunit